MPSGGCGCGCPCHCARVLAVEPILPRPRGIRRSAIVGDNLLVSAFTPAEIAYLRSQTLCRLATATTDGHPHVVPVTFVYNEVEDTIDIGGHDFATRKKWRDVGRNSEVALVVDDIASFDPWHVRMLEVRGNAERLLDGGKKAIGDHVDAEMFRIQSVGINEGAERIASRQV